MLHLAAPEKPEIESSPDVLESYNRKLVTGKIGNTVKVLTKTSIIIECKANGIPKPNYRWSSEDVLLHGSDTFNTSDNGQLLKFPAIKKDDSGKYVCIAENDAGLDSKFVTLEVYGK